MPEILRPSDLDEARELLREGAAAGLSQRPCGKGSRLRRHVPAAAPRRWLSFAAFDRILELDPDEQICVVEAGTPPAVLDAAAGRHGLELGVRSPMAREGTLGGLFLAPEVSLASAVHGPPRDQVLGARWLLADGSVVRSGARVVKSVAGYDLTRLLLGSRGRLAACLELTLRLRPRPRAPHWFRFEARPESLRDLLAGPSGRDRYAIRILRGGEVQDWLCCEGEDPPPAVLAPRPATIEEGEAALEAALEAFAAAPARIRPTDPRTLFAAPAQGLPAVDWLGGQAACATLPDPRPGVHRIPQSTPSPWLERLAEACAPGTPPFERG